MRDCSFALLASCILCVLCMTLRSYALEKSFEIDYERGTFLKDGQPYRFISGAIHYFRIPRASWRDRLLKAHAAGLDAVETYVPWNLHEPEPGNLDFAGERDVAEFLRAANDIGLLVILRTGPYVCAELDMGGLPSWLLQKDELVPLRSSDPRYLPLANQWLEAVFKKVVKPNLYEAGGPVVAVQLENEYGFSDKCDRKYMTSLHSDARRILGEKVVLFTVDPPDKQDCGAIPDLALATVDFGVDVNPATAFASQRRTNAEGYSKMKPGKDGLLTMGKQRQDSLRAAGIGPEVNMEFYTGWLDHWKAPRERRDAKRHVEALDKMLARNASVNFYMFAGGTNFGYLNGANWEANRLTTQPTTYDYDAPISEAGDTTWKYELIRSTIAKYKQIPSVPVPPNSTKFAYGSIVMHELVSLADLADSEADAQFWLSGMRRGVAPKVSLYPRSMEQSGIWRGFALYTSVNQEDYPAGTLRFDKAVRDRAYVFDSDWTPLGVIDRNDPMSHRLELPNPTRSIHVLVENIGHVNFGSIGFGEWKGLVRNVTLSPKQARVAQAVAEFEYDADGKSNLPDVVLSNWKVVHVDVDRVYARLVTEKRPVAAASNKRFGKLVGARRVDLHAIRSGKQPRLPAFFLGDLHVDEPHDTFVRISGGWKKGQLLVNGVNLGRYWPGSRCPQRTLYVPASVLRKGSNKIMLFELEGGHQCDISSAPLLCKVTFVSQPEIDVKCDSADDDEFLTYDFDRVNNNKSQYRNIIAVCLLIFAVWYCYKHNPFALLRRLVARARSWQVQSKKL